MDAVEVDILRGESRTPDFLAKNPSGTGAAARGRRGTLYRRIQRHPVVSSPTATPLSPELRIESAEALQWMFFEQHALEPNIGAAYFWLALVKGGRVLQTHALEDWMERGYAALQVMENHLKTHDYFAANQLTVADIALYGYTHVAELCDFELLDLPLDPRLAETGRADPSLRLDGLAAGRGGRYPEHRRQRLKCDRVAIAL